MASGDRFVVRRSQYDFEPEDKLPHLIEFAIVGPRGARRSVSVDARLARRYWERLGKLLGESTRGATPEGNE